MKSTSKMMRKKSHKSFKKSYKKKKMQPMMANSNSKMSNFRKRLAAISLRGKLIRQRLLSILSRSKKTKKQLKKKKTTFSH